MLNTSKKQWTCRGVDEALLDGDVRKRDAEAQRASPPKVWEASQGCAIGDYHQYLAAKDRCEHVPHVNHLLRRNPQKSLKANSNFDRRCSRCGQQTKEKTACLMVQGSVLVKRNAKFCGMGLACSGSGKADWSSDCCSRCFSEPKASCRCSAQRLLHLGLLHQAVRS